MAGNPAVAERMRDRRDLGGRGLMIDMYEFQEAGAPYRRGLGIDGTAGDAQDIPHSYTEDVQFPAVCIVCGLSASYRKHQESAD